MVDNVESIKKNIRNRTQELEKALATLSSAQELEKVRISFLGKKGTITTLFSILKDLKTEDKRIIGPLLTELKNKAEKDIKEKRELLLHRQRSAHIHPFDVTAYKPGVLSGHLHPLSQFTQKIETLFLSMGYSLLDGPEVETDEYNFGALNIPDDHPARDMYDTLWLTIPKLLLRTHTSTVQIHAMKKHDLPLAGVATGRVFRHEATDASHDFMFMQCEGIVIDEGINLTHLFGTVKHFLHALFNTNDLDIRIRPGFFPFVEPGVEIDMRCPFCSQGCNVCKKTTWIEVFPGGLIHPHVLRHAGIDHHKYSGFAFGFGLTRLAMLHYGIHDIRLFHYGKQNFLQQF